MRQIIILTSAVLVLLSCRSTRSAMQPPITSVVIDTINVLPAKPVVLTEKPTFDSAAYKAEVYTQLSNSKITFSTFSAKAKVDFELNNGSDNATAYVRIKNDSLIWISLRGALGIEGARVLITPDSVILLNTLKKEVTKRSIGFLREVSKLPFDFYTLQNVLVGNPIYLDPNIVNIEVNQNSDLMLLMRSVLFEHLLTITATGKTPLVSKLQFINTANNLNCTLQYSAFDEAAGFPFSTKRVIEVNEKTNAKFTLEIKSFSFNEPLTYPFEMPKKVKEL